MKRNSLLTILAIAIVFILSLTMLTACGDEKHDFPDKWEHDETSHWHECATKNHTDTTEKLQHEFTWTEKTPASVHTDKVEKGVCECGYETERIISGTATHAYGEEWKKDATGHWHESTCDATAPTHEVMKADFAEHTFDEGKVTKPEDYGVVGEKTFTCTECKYSYTKDIDALGAKDNEIKLASGKTLGKTYDGQSITITKADFVIEGNRNPVFKFKVKGANDNTYTATAPTNAGEYTVKVSVESTPEWKAASKTFDFTIAKKELTGTGTKEYDGTETMPATLTGVLGGETVTAKITMTSKNVGATVQSVTLEGANKDNYTIKTTGVTASITPKAITVEWGERPYNNSKILTGEPAGMIAGDEATIAITMSSANVGATVQSFEITGKDAGNYSLAREDISVEIIKANIYGFEISNASAFTEFFVGATNIPEPTTDYVEIGTGYGEKTVVWEKQLENGSWSPTTKEEVTKRKGTYHVRIQYAEGENYNSKATEYVSFTMKVKERSLTVNNFTGKTYDGNPVANFTYENLEKLVGTAEIPGVKDIASPYDGEKYVEFRKKGEALWTKVTGSYIPKQAGEYEYRIGIAATDEWAAVVSDIKSFKIAQVEIKLEKGYVTTSSILQNGDLLYLATYTPVTGETVALRLVNGKAGLELTAPGSGYVKAGQKKQVSVQDNLDCFRLTATTNTNLSNYKIVKNASQTSVEIAVVSSERSTSNSIQEAWKSADGNQLFLDTSVKTGYFQVGQTVIVYDSTGTKLFETKIVKVHVGIGMNSQVSQSGCVIPSDGMVRIDIDVTGITYSGTIKGGYIIVKT